jgi:hypothetical protein
LKKGKSKFREMFRISGISKSNEKIDAKCSREIAQFRSVEEEEKNKKIVRQVPAPPPPPPRQQTTRNWEKEEEEEEEKKCVLSKNGREEKKIVKASYHLMLIFYKYIFEKRVGRERHICPERFQGK